MCSLCVTYKEGDDEIKVKLKERYEKHTLEKVKVRERKEESKVQSCKDKSILCAVFDLQQVIYLPVSRESAIFL